MEENVKKGSGRTIPINTNRKGGKRLRPILDVLLDENVSIAELADKIGITRQSLNRWFVVDDARLTGLEEVGKALGYHLEWKYVKDED